MLIVDPIFLIVEELASRIKRSVAVDDAALNYIAHSSHRFNDEDQIRLQSITERQLPEPVLTYIMSMNLPSLREPVVVPAQHKYGFEHDRLLVPIRSAQELIGVLWTTYSPSLSEEDKRLCQQAARRLAPLLVPAVSISESVIVERHLLNLVSDDQAVRAATADMLVTHGLVQLNNPKIVFAAGIPGKHEFDHQEHAEFRRVWLDATGRIYPHLLSAHDQAHVFGLIEVTGEYSITDLQQSLGSVYRYLNTRLRSSFKDLRVGVGTLRSIDEVHISYLEAISAVGMGAYLDDSVILWDEHPLEALLELAVSDAITECRLPTILRKTLLGLNSEIVDTVACYLDLAGSVLDVAREKHLHRATIYYRINQFEQETGLNLRSGRDRLLVHMGIQLRSRITQ